MKTTAINPRKSTRKTTRKTTRKRANPATNPRRRTTRRSTTKRSTGRRSTARRSYRRNPSVNIAGGVWAALGGVALRVALRKVGGLWSKDKEGHPTLSTTHWLAAAAGIYLLPDAAKLVGASPAEAEAAQVGGAAILGSMLVDRYFDDVSAKHLLPMDSPRPVTEAGTTLTEGVSGRKARAGLMGWRDYYALAGNGGVDSRRTYYVTHPDGSVWAYQGGRRRALSGGMRGMGQVPRRSDLELPPGSQVGDVVRDLRTGNRYLVAARSNGQLQLRPMGDDAETGLGGMDPYLASVV